MMLADRYVISQYCCRGVQVWHLSHSPAHATVKLRINTPYVQTGLSPGQDWVSTRPHSSLIALPSFGPLRARGMSRGESHGFKNLSNGAILCGFSRIPFFTCAALPMQGNRDSS